MDLQSSITLVLISLSILLTIKLATKAYSHHKLPPGPRSRIPFVGAAFQLPQENGHLVFHKWASTYGPIVGLTAFGQNLVLLNTAEVSDRLLNGKSFMYSERPPFPMLEMMSFNDWNIGTMPLGEKHKLGRQLLIQATTPTALPRYTGMLNREIQRLLTGLVRNPERFSTTIRNFNVNMLLQIFFGIHPNDHYADDLVTLNDELMKATTVAGLPTAYAVNTFPILKYWLRFLPGSGFKKDVDTARNLINKLHQIPFASSAKPESCFILNYNSDVDANTRDVARSVALTVYGATVETTTSTLSAFFLAMVLYPTVQEKAQQEIDTHIHGRLPQPKDREGKFEYIDAILMECYRWAPAGHLGLPRMLTQDDEVDGFVLPKGTVVMSNIWTIMHDSAVYKDPHTFNPDRFLGSNPEPDPRRHVFGYGKRVCPGRYLAEEILWLQITSILTVFRLRPKCDKAGKPCLPTVEFTSGIMSRPKNFECSIELRSAAKGLLET